MQILWFLVCVCFGHKLYQVDEGHDPVFRKKRCARCSYETESYPIDTIGPFTVRAYKREHVQPKHLSEND